jgi:hypothetical protein
MTGQAGLSAGAIGTSLTYASGTKRSDARSQVLAFTSAERNDFDLGR